MGRNFGKHFANNHHRKRPYQQSQWAFFFESMSFSSNFFFWDNLSNFMFQKLYTKTTETEYRTYIAQGKWNRHYGIHNQIQRIHWNYQTKVKFWFEIYEKIFLIFSNGYNIFEKKKKNTRLQCKKKLFTEFLIFTLTKLDLMGKCVNWRIFRCPNHQKVILILDSSLIMSKYLFIFRSRRRTGKCRRFHSISYTGKIWCNSCDWKGWPTMYGQCFSEY